MLKCLIGFDPELYPAVYCFEGSYECIFCDYDYEYLIKNIANFNVIVPHLKVHLSKTILESAINLECIATPSTGLDHIDIEFSRSLGLDIICLHDDRGFIDTITSTSEFAWLLVMASIRRLRSAVNRVVEEKSWINIDIRGYQLQDKVVGIMGFGRLGKHVARYANTFGCRVLAYDIDETVFEGVNDVEPVSFERLLAESDIISLHMTLTESSVGIIDAESVGRMKDGVVLVNTSRGALIDSYAVLKGVENGKIGMVAIDVANNELCEGRLPNDPLVAASMGNDRILVTPHIGGATYDAHSLVFNKVYELLLKRSQGETE
jgi:D-3-phosphoglycerate dehydrogenase